MLFCKPYFDKSRRMTGKTKTQCFYIQEFMNKYQKVKTL